MSSKIVRAPELSVVVIDDHDAIRAAVELWCGQADPPIEVISYASADAFLEQDGGNAEKRDVVVFDLELESRRPAFAALEGVVECGHRVVVYSHITAPEVILRTLDLGAVSYLAKSEGKGHLMSAIADVGQGLAYVGPRMAAAMYNDRSVGRPNLGARELEVLLGWFQTESKELVGRRLEITPSTVRTHLQRVRAKYAAVGRPAPTKAALVARAIQDGIISVDDL